MEATIRPLSAIDRNAATTVINTAAGWYQEFLPPEELHDPEMTPEQWDAEAKRMTWYGAFQADTLVGVAGLEYVKEAVLFRHCYVLPEQQRLGVGSLLTRHLESQVRGVQRIVIGTYAANHQARGALEKMGYHLSHDSIAVLRSYYAIPEDRLVSSITYEKELEHAAGNTERKPVRDSA